MKKILAYTKAIIINFPVRAVLALPFIFFGNILYMIGEGVAGKLYARHAQIVQDKAMKQVNNSQQFMLRQRMQQNARGNRKSKRR